MAQDIFPLQANIDHVLINILYYAATKNITAQGQPKRCEIHTIMIPSPQPAIKNRRSLVRQLIWLIFLFLEAQVLLASWMAFEQQIRTLAIRLDKQVRTIAPKMRISEQEFRWVQKVGGLMSYNEFVRHRLQPEQAPPGLPDVVFQSGHLTGPMLYYFASSPAQFDFDRFGAFYTLTEKTRWLRLINSSALDERTYSFISSPDGKLMSIMPLKSPMAPDFKPGDLARTGRWLHQLKADYQLFQGSLNTMTTAQESTNLHKGFWLNTVFNNQQLKQTVLMNGAGIYENGQLIAYYIAVLPVRVLLEETPNAEHASFTIIPQPLKNPSADSLLSGALTRISMSSSRQLLFQSKGIRINQPLPDSPLALDMHVSWQQILKDQHWTIGYLSALAILLALLSRWAFRLIDRKLLLPDQQKTRQIIEARNFAETVIQFMPVGLCIIDMQSRQMTVQNQAARELLDRIDCANPLSLLIPSEINQQAVDEQELHLPQRDAPPLTILRASLRASLDNHPLLICTLIDTTERTRAHQAIQAALTQANDAKSRFLSTMSHEIRTPLHGALASLELLARTPHSKIQHEYIDAIQISSNALLAVINDILDFSKIEANHLQLENIQFPPDEIMENVLVSFHATAKQKQLELYGLISPDMPVRLRGDPQRLSQILSNLLSNALKFTDSGRIVVRLSGAFLSTDQYLLRISVTDTGIGISQEIQTRLFEPFVQAESHIQRHYGGTGLGLAIVDRIARAMGGQTSVVSMPGLGSCFTVELHLSVEPGTPHANQQIVPGLLCYVKAPSAEALSVLEMAVARCGGQAIPWRVQEQVSAQGIILEYCLDSDEPAPALPAQHGGWIRVTPNGPRVAERTIHGTLLVSSFSPSALDKALRTLANPQPSDQPAAPQSRQDRLSVAEDQLAFCPAVLLVEDHPMNRLILQQQLQSIGCHVTLAANAEEALSLPVHHHDLLITDGRLPGMSGYELVRELRSQSLTLPMLIITAGSADQIGKQVQGSGADGFLLKPVSRAELLRTLHRLLSPPARDKQVSAPQAQAALPASDVRQVYLNTWKEDADKLQATIDSPSGLADQLHRIEGIFRMLEDQQGLALCLQFDLHEPASKQEGIRQIIRHLRNLATRFSQAGKQA